jgi:hypothetical protein
MVLVWREWFTLDRTCVHALAVDGTCGPSDVRSFTITGDSPNEEMECLIAVDDSDTAMRAALLSAVVEEQSRR